MTVVDLSLADIAEGAAARFQHRVTAADIDAFVSLSGDRNPLHADEGYARESGFRGRVAHGALLAALVSRLIGTELPGRRALLLNLRLDFVAPTYAGDEVTVQAEVASVHASQGVIKLDVAVRCDAEVRARGSALVRIREEAT